MVNHRADLPWYSAVNHGASALASGHMRELLHDGKPKMQSLHYICGPRPMAMPRWPHRERSLIRLPHIRHPPHFQKRLNQQGITGITRMHTHEHLGQGLEYVAQTLLPGIYLFSLFSL